MKTFVGTSANALKTQLWTALIAMLLVKYLQLKSSFGWSLSNLVALLRQQLFVYRDLWVWIDHPFQAPELYSAARATGDGLAVVGQQPTSPRNYSGQIDDFGSCNLDSIHRGNRSSREPTCFVRRQERMIMSRIFSSAEQGPQLTWTAMLPNISNCYAKDEGSSVTSSDLKSAHRRPES